MRRRGGVVSQAVVVATGVSIEGPPEILSMDLVLRIVSSLMLGFGRIWGYGAFSCFSFAAF